MASDRGLTLTVRAAVRGAIDFRQAKIRDVNWWRRTNLILSEIGREDDTAATMASYLYHLALVANGSLSDDGFKAEQQKAKAAFTDYVALTHPWAERVQKQRQMEDMKRMKEMYEQLVGDLNDPVTRERWKREAERLEAFTANRDPTAATMAAVNAAIAEANKKTAPVAVALD